eukprot:TRINITY_DN25683_c0_g1_i1.p1 TRINITY_DN25683_c0_g1~~TRINITY_DN25683_c0_g1_i1.p1  ORF type:complete len:577 (-),score=159.48 TRINITY_DN25683_c0_g1_i1:273-2003(-)
MKQRAVRARRAGMANIGAHGVLAKWRPGSPALLLLLLAAARSAAASFPSILRARRSQGAWAAEREAPRRLAAVTAGERSRSVGKTVSVTFMGLPDGLLTREDYVATCAKAQLLPVCEGGADCPGSDASDCVSLQVEAENCGHPMRGVAQALGYPDAAWPFFENVCNYEGRGREGAGWSSGACAGVDGYVPGDEVSGQRYVLCTARPLAAVAATEGAGRGQAPSAPANKATEPADAERNSSELKRVIKSVMHQNARAEEKIQRMQKEHEDELQRLARADRQRDEAEREAAAWRERYQQAHATAQKEATEAARAERSRNRTSEEAASDAATLQRLRAQLRQVEAAKAKATRELQRAHAEAAEASKQEGDDGAAVGAAVLAVALGGVGLVGISCLMFLCYEMLRSQRRCWTNAFWARPGGDSQEPLLGCLDEDAGACAVLDDSEIGRPPPPSSARAEAPSPQEDVRSEALDSAWSAAESCDAWEGFGDGGEGPPVVYHLSRGPDSDAAEMPFCDHAADDDATSSTGDRAEVEEARSEVTHRSGSETPSSGRFDSAGSAESLSGAGGDWQLVSSSRASGP